MKRLAASLALVVMLSGCGLRPLYGGGEGGKVATTLSLIEVAPIEGKSGWLMSNALRDRLGATGTAQYQLVVKLDDQITGLGVRRDNTLLAATAGSDAGIDVVGSEYATIAAENSALERLSGIVADQIVSRVALYADRTPPAAR
jgi:LPS-assembly lipoprotein